MYIIGVTACTVGIAHTYIAEDKLIQAAKKLNHEVKIETQGNVGAENVLTEEDIKRADIVIIASDININGRDRFKGKKVVQIPITVAIKSPEGLIKQIEEKLKGE
ncbi:MULTISPECIES: PTS fructose transporter subunit IIB [unclassified Bacillus (in: firmicutes)]|uniref:PTS fructose transporter subunit IIB n=1 Tax=unclassified Bacillus (in: firmicutes) TaxID=185979 RepID=UPI0004E1572D|nr:MULTISPECIES: PTS fructose transporter subunit IIB [unclassified Bacillus (in: firmicutes)]